VPTLRHQVIVERVRKTTKILVKVAVTRLVFGLQTSKIQVQIDIVTATLQKGRRY